MKTKSLLVTLIMYSWILSACQSALIPATATATIVPSTKTPVPTNTMVPTATQVPTATPAMGDTRVSEADGMVQVYVPAGKFLMGTSDEQMELMIAQHPDWKRGLIMHDLDGNEIIIEQPQNSVSLDAFWMDQTEVTNAMFAQCVEAGECDKPYREGSYTRDIYYGNSEYNDYPVVWVGWIQARSYCEWVGRRLPTEAEWEKAARGTDERRYPWGEELSCDLANYGSSCVGDTSPVGSYPAGASPYGALDMAGNAFEWVNSLFANYPYEAGASRENTTDTENWRILRGGSWNTDGRAIRTAHRGASDPSMARPDGGFRCASNAE